MRDFIEVTLNNGRTVLFVDKIDLIAGDRQTELVYNGTTIHPKESLNSLKAKLRGTSIGPNANYFKTVTDGKQYKMTADTSNGRLFVGVVVPEAKNMIVDLIVAAGGRKVKNTETAETVGADLFGTTVLFFEKHAVD